MPPLEKNETPNAFEPVNSTAVDLKASLSPASQARALDGPEFYWLQHTLPRDSACAEAGGAISLTHLAVCVCVRPTHAGVIPATKSSCQKPRGHYRSSKGPPLAEVVLGPPGMAVGRMYYPS